MERPEAFSKHFYFLLSLLVGGVLLFGSISVTFAQAGDTLAGQSEAFRKSAGFELPKDPRKIVALLANVVLIFLGSVMLGYTILGGYFIMTAAGIEDRIAKGRRAIWTSVVGLGIILSAYGITRYALLLTDYAANEDRDVEYQSGDGFSVDVDVQEDVDVPDDPLYEPGYDGSAWEDLGVLR